MVRKSKIIEGLTVENIWEQREGRHGDVVNGFILTHPNGKKEQISYPLEIGMTAIMLRDMIDENPDIWNIKYPETKYQRFMRIYKGL